MIATLASAARGLEDDLQALAERPEGVTVASLIERRMAVYTGRDRSSIYRLEAWVQLLGHRPLEKVDGDVIHAARARLATLPALAFKGRDHEDAQVFKPKTRNGMKSGPTINRYVAALSSVFTWAIAERLTPRGWANPCRGIKRLPEPSGRVKFLDPKDRDELLAACKVSKYPRFHALVLLAMLTGARKGEILALKWGDVDLEAGIARLGRTKNGDRRTLILLPQVVAALRPFSAAEPGRFVFGAGRTRNTTPASIDTTWRQAVARAGLKDFRFHDLRHCCASYLVQNGVDLSVVAEILGHRKLDMTRRYAHLKTETKAKAMHAALAGIGA